MKVRWRGGGISLAQHRDFIQQLQSLTGEAPSIPMELNPKEFQGFHLALLNKVRMDHWDLLLTVVTWMFTSNSLFKSL